MNDDLTSASDFFFHSLKTMGNSIASALPGIVSALVVFLMGWLIAKVISWIVLRVLNRINFDGLAQKIEADAFLKNAKLEQTPSGLISKFIYWVLMLFVFITVTDMLGWHKVSEEIGKLLGYLPKIFFAIVFFIIGIYIATFVRKIITGATASIGLSAGRLIGTVVFYFMMIVVTITSLDQAGMDTTMLSSNLLMIIGAILLAASVSYSIASIDYVKNILAGFFTRKTFNVGQRIEVDNEIGNIKDINNLSVILEKDNGEEVMIPTKILLNSKVRILPTK